MGYVQSEPEQVFTDANGVQWKRGGYCCRCGECCKGNPFTGEIDEQINEGFCPLFKWVIKHELASCTDRQNAYYLGACRHWPSHPKHIKALPKCTYTFERLG